MAVDQHSRSADGEDVGAVVVLALVALVRGDPARAPATTADAHAHLEQVARLVPVDQLGPDDAHHRGLPGRIQQVREGLGLRGAVVMHQPDPLGHVVVGAALVGQTQPHRVAKAGAPSGTEHRSFAQPRSKQVERAVVGAGVDRDQDVDRPGLVGERVQDSGQPQ